MLSKRETFAALSLMIASTGLFLLAFGIRTTWLPDVRARSGDSEALQSVWGLEAAVLLKAVENIAGFGAVLVLMAVVVGANPALDAVPGVARLTLRCRPRLAGSIHLRCKIGLLICIKADFAALHHISPDGDGLQETSRAMHRGDDMMPTTVTRKSMTIGEGGTALAFVALAVSSIFVAAGAHTPEYAFHAWLSAAASVATVFAIVNRYYDRPAQLPPLTIDGKPNYNMGPVKFATVAAVFWGIAGFSVGLWAALELAFPVLNFDLPWISFGRIRPLHTSAVIFAFGGNVLVGDLVLCGAAHLPRAGSPATSRPWFVVLGYNFFIVIAGTGYLLGITQSKEYAEPEWYADLWLTVVWVTYFLVVSRHHHAAQRAAYLCRQLVLSRLHPDDRRAASRQQRRDPGVGCTRPSPTSSGAGVQDAWCSGGTGTTRSASS